VRGEGLRRPLRLPALRELDAGEVEDGSGAERVLSVAAGVDGRGRGGASW
jgi:hypothetical protein